MENTKKLIILVGPPGSGKSTHAKTLEYEGFTRISQDDQGKQGHLQLFTSKLEENANICVDRMGFSKEQRSRYIEPAKKAGYTIEIVVFHVPRQVCYDRCMERRNHPTINGDKYCGDDTIIGNKNVQSEQANAALDTFFTKYERVEDSEADKVERKGWDVSNHKTKPCITIDLDGTLCNIEHRLHHVKHEVKKHNRWDLFNKEIVNDSVNEWCKKLLLTIGMHHPIILCSGRVDSTRNDTENWLVKNGIKQGLDYRHLFMRHYKDFRQDFIIKQIILDFEIKTRYNVLMAIDDRLQVTEMWRKNGIVCLQCEKGDF